MNSMLGKLVDGRIKRKLRKILAQWRFYTAERKSIERSVLTSSNNVHLDHIILSYCLRLWKDRIMTLRTSKHKVYVTLMRRTFRLLKSSLAIWRDYTCRRIDGRNLMKKQAMYNIRQLFKIVFVVWRAMSSIESLSRASHEYEINEAICNTEIQAKEESRLLYMSIEAFRLNVQTFSNRKRLFVFLRSRIEKRLLHVTYHAWKVLCKTKMQSLQRAGDVITASQTTFMLRVFSKWHLLARESHFKSINLQTIAIKIKKTQSISKYSAWTSWRTLTLAKRERQKMVRNCL